MTMTGLARGPRPGNNPLDPAPAGLPHTPQQPHESRPTQFMAVSSHLTIHLDPDDTLAVEVRSCGEITVQVQRPGQSLKLIAARDATDALRKLHSAIGWALADHDTRTARPYLLARAASTNPTEAAHLRAATMPPDPDPNTC